MGHTTVQIHVVPPDCISKNGQKGKFYVIVYCGKKQWEGEWPGWTSLRRRDGSKDEEGVVGRLVALRGIKQPRMRPPPVPVCSQNNTEPAPHLPHWRVLGSPEAGMGGVGPRRLFGQGKWRREMTGSNRKPSAHQEQRPQVLAFVCPTTGCPSHAAHKGAKPVACVTRLENKEARPSFIVPVLSSCGTVLHRTCLSSPPLLGLRGLAYPAMTPSSVWPWGGR